MLASSNKSGWMHCKKTYIDDQMLATKQVCSTIALIGILRPLAAGFFDEIPSLNRACAQPRPCRLLPNFQHTYFLVLISVRGNFHVVFVMDWILHIFWQKKIS